jgi:hypothetical protein
MNGLLRQLANAGSHGRQLDEDALNFMLSVVIDIKPKDQLEAMLAAQMAAIHTATMTFARRLAHVETIDQQDSQALPACFPFVRTGMMPGPRRFIAVES